jgi:PhnB protein
MAKAKKAIPDGYHTITPYLIVRDAAKAITWYEKALGAKERFRMDGPNGTIGHAELQVGDSVLMLADEAPEMGAQAPQSVGGSPVGFMIYVEDCDRAFARALEAGATVERPLKDQFYGDRSGTIVDPFGHKWTIGSHVEDVTPEEMKRRGDEMMKQHQG